MELAQKCIVEEERRERKTSGGERRTSEEITVKVQQKFFQNSTSTFGGLKSRLPTPKRFSSIEKNVHGVFSVYKKICN